MRKLLFLLTIAGLTAARANTESPPAEPTVKHGTDPTKVQGDPETEGTVKAEAPPGVTESRALSHILGARIGDHLFCPKSTGTSGKAVGQRTYYFKDEFFGWKGELTKVAQDAAKGQHPETYCDGLAASFVGGLKSKAQTFATDRAKSAVTSASPKDLASSKGEWKEASSLMSSMNGLTQAFLARCRDAVKAAQQSAEALGKVAGAKAVQDPALKGDWNKAFSQVESQSSVLYGAGFIDSSKCKRSNKDFEASKDRYAVDKNSDEYLQLQSNTTADAGKDVVERNASSSEGAPEGERIKEAVTKLRGDAAELNTQIAAASEADKPALRQRLDAVRQDLARIRAYEQTLPKEQRRQDTASTTAAPPTPRADPAAVENGQKQVLAALRSEAARDSDLNGDAAATDAWVASSEKNDAKARGIAQKLLTETETALTELGRKTQGPSDRQIKRIEELEAQRSGLKAYLQEVGPAPDTRLDQGIQGETEFRKYYTSQLRSNPKHPHNLDGKFKSMDSAGLVGIVRDRIENEDWREQHLGREINGAIQAKEAEIAAAKEQGKSRAEIGALELQRQQLTAYQRRFLQEQSPVGKATRALASSSGTTASLSSFDKANEGKGVPKADWRNEAGANAAQIESLATDMSHRMFGKTPSARSYYTAVDAYAVRENGKPKYNGTGYDVNYDAIEAATKGYTYSQKIAFTEAVKRALAEQVKLYNAGK